jgi:hypothetical protein
MTISELGEIASATEADKSSKELGDRDHLIMTRGLAIPRPLCNIVHEAL